MKRSQNKQFLLKSQTNESFLKKMHQVSLKFQQIQQLAHYSPPSEPGKKMVVSLKRSEEQWWSGGQQDTENIEIFVGSKLPRGSKSIETILLNISILTPRPTQPYSVVFINTLADSSAYSDFKKALEYLPLEYYVQLQSIYVLHASFKEKAYDFITFDYVAGYIKSKITYYDSFEKLAKRIGFSCKQALTVLPIEIVTQFSQKEASVKLCLQTLKHSENNSSNTSIPKQMGELHAHQKKNSTKPASKSIEEYEVGQTGAPLIIELLIHFFDKDEIYLSVEGLFRKSADIEEETELLSQIDSQNYDYLESITNPHLVANAIKRFLANLKEPIFPYHHFDQFMKATPAGRKYTLLKSISSLERNRIMTLLLLIEFFKEKLFPREKDNLMNKENMSVVIGPCLMRAEILSISDFIYAQKIIDTTQILFNDFDELFGSKVERLKVIRNSVCLQQKWRYKEKLGSLEQEDLPEDNQFPTFLQSTGIVKQQTSLTEEQIQSLEAADQFLNAFYKK